MKPTRTGPPLRGASLLDAISTGRLNEDAIVSLHLAAQFWLESGGETSMERFLRLPTTGAKLKNATRNHWLRKAADTLGDPSPFKRACHLERELSAFITRGAWATWKESQNPPDGCSELRRCLFYVAKFNDGEGLTDRTIYEALK
jgi:hypothetical protein